MKRRASRRPAAVPVVEVAYEFGFDAAHQFDRVPRGHKYRGVHGHSFRVEVALRGAPRAPHGFVADLERVERACLGLRRQLDHSFLNKIKNLNNPSLENIALWIWDRLGSQLRGLARVTVRRDSLGQSATYFGSDAVRRKMAGGRES